MVKNPNVTQAKNFRFFYSTVDEYFLALKQAQEKK
jgi:hypothetical protein